MGNNIKQIEKERSASSLDHITVKIQISLNTETYLKIMKMFLHSNNGSYPPYPCPKYHKYY